jgi:transcriptional regulator with XRE-family HTH domain
MSDTITSVSPPSPIDLIIGANIRNRRKYLAKTMAQVSIEVGVSWQQWAKYESGANRVSAATLWKVANALGVPVESLYQGVKS